MGRRELEVGRKETSSKIHRQYAAQAAAQAAGDAQAFYSGTGAGLRLKWGQSKWREKYDFQVNFQDIHITFLVGIG